MTVLRRSVGEARVDAEPQAAGKLVGSCAGLPLALRITSARLTAKPHLQLTEAAAHLEGSRKQLDELAVGDQAVRSSFTLSYAAL
jgi:hypothetical protein